MSAAEPQTAPTNVTIRIVTFAHGSTRNDDLYLVLNLDTTIRELRSRVQEELAQHPTPETQRFIYQGRPLLDDNSTLRQILRLQTGTTNSTSAHVFHLVIRDQAEPPGGAPNIPTTAVPQSIALPPLNQPIIHRPAFPIQTPNLTTIPNTQHFRINQNVQPGIRPDYDHLHEALRLHNQALAANPHHFGAQTPIGHMNSVNNIQHPPGPQNSANTDPNTTQHTEETTYGPNGERITRITHVHNLQPVPVPQTAPSIERSTSAPGTTQPQTQPSTGAPQGTAPVTSSQNPPIPPQQRVNDLHRAVHAMGVRTSLLQAHPPPPGINVMGPFGGGNQAPIPHFPVSALRPSVNPAQLHPFASSQASQPMAWLLSSPSGPQGMVFAPGHGFFSSTPSQPVNTTAQTQGRHSNTVPPTTGSPTTTSPTPPVGQPQQPNPANGANQPRAVVLRDDLRRPEEPGQARARLQNIQGDDLLALAVQRGWLFIRLYMFIFVLSEAGTWRRMIMLTLAVFYCLLPRSNPLTDLFNAARRYIDALIGPPPRPTAGPHAGQEGQANGNNTNTDPATDAVPPADQQRPNGQMPTPEEHARRLLQERRNREPNFMREMIRPIEQAIALFLASLIPGVGERHVRAREEARRTIAEEEERRRREQEEQEEQRRAQTDDSNGTSQLQEGPSTEGDSSSTNHKKTEAEMNASTATTLVDHGVGSSTGVEAAPTSVSSHTDAAEGVRQRTTVTTEDAPSSESAS